MTTEQLLELLAKTNKKIEDTAVHVTEAQLDDRKYLIAKLETDIKSAVQELNGEITEA